MPRSMRPPLISSRTASDDAVTLGSRVAGLVTQVPEAHRRGGLGHERQERVRVAPQDVGVEEPAVTEARCLGLAREGQRALDGVVGLERESEVHGAGAYTARSTGCHGLQRGA